MDVSLLLPYYKVHARFGFLSAKGRVRLLDVWRLAEERRLDLGNAAAWQAAQLLLRERHLYQGFLTTLYTFLGDPSAEAEYVSPNTH